MMIEPTGRMPSWMTTDLMLELESQASLALPNEYFAFLIRAGTEIRVIPLGGEFSPTQFKVDSNALVSFCYQLELNWWDICATVHSHPQGQKWFSKADEQLVPWAELHLVLVYDEGMWSPVWGRNGRLTAESLDKL